MMCTGAEFASGLGSAGKTIGALGAITTASGLRSQGDAARSLGNAQASIAEADAAYEMDAAAQQAEKILRAAQREKGAARAATAASGARIDEFATGAENEIDSLAHEDAAMTILSGVRRGRSLRYGGELARAAGENQRSASLFRSNAALMEGLSGWKGAKAAPDVVDDGYSVGQGSAYGGNRRGM